MASILNRWTGASWEAITNGTIVMFGSGAQGTIISSAESIDNNTTKIIFSEDVQDFIVAQNLSAFFIIGEVYWVPTLFIINDIVKVDARTYILSHSSISNTDYGLLVCYNETSGNILDINNNAVSNSIVYYVRTYGSLILVRQRVYINYPISGLDGDDVDVDYEVDENTGPDPVEEMEEDLEYFAVNDDQVSVTVTISIL